MTWPSTQPPAQPPQGRLRDVHHPDLSSVLYHFCDRGRPLGGQVAPGIRAMSAPDRLGSILHHQQLAGYTTFSGGLPAVCFTEATPNGLSFLLTHRSHQPWALAVERQSVYDAGGAPVWYARPEQYNRLDPMLRSWAVRLEPPRSDWLDEREWRIVLHQQPSVPLSWLRVLGIIVGDRAWTGAYNLVQPHTNGALWNYPCLAPFPPWLTRWYWNPMTEWPEVAYSPP